MKIKFETIPLEFYDMKNTIMSSITDSFFKSLKKIKNKNTIEAFQKTRKISFILSNISTDLENNIEFPIEEIVYEVSGLIMEHLRVKYS